MRRARVGLIGRLTAGCGRAAGALGRRAAGPAAATRAMRGRDPGSSIRWLRLLVAASVIVPVFLFCGAAWENRQQVINEAERSTRQTVASLHEHAEKVLETQELV